MTKPYLQPKDGLIIWDIVARVFPNMCFHVYIFGSRVSETSSNRSDIDLAFNLGRVITLAEMIQLKQAFDDSLLAVTVDIVDLQSALDPIFRQNIESSMLPLPEF